MKLVKYKDVKDVKMPIPANVNCATQAKSSLMEIA
jgi:hypothetical protein